MSDKSDTSDSFIDELYEMSGGNLPFDRYKVGNKLGLDKEQTDAVVEELAALGRIQKTAETEVSLTPEEKKFQDNERGDI